MKPESNKEIKENLSTDEESIKRGLKDQAKQIFDDLIDDTDNKGVVQWLKYKRKKVKP